MGRIQKVWLWVGLVTVILTVVRSAWLCDDAYITFRTVSNIIDGFGPVWNVTERVQGYTHPLWMMLLTTVSFFSGELYFTSIILSILLSAAAFIILVRYIGDSFWSAMLCVFAILLSKPLVDFAASGLENPLSYLLLTVFYWVFLIKPGNVRSVLLLTVLASLLVLTRLDNILLVGPALIGANFCLKSKDVVRVNALGWLPLVLWLVFSLWYYGVPFPNTAYAKLGSGIPRDALISQGMVYLINLIKWSPFSAALIAAGAVYGINCRDRKLLAPTASIVLCLVYVVWVGGDFMSGRFLTAPIILSLIVLSRSEIKPTFTKETTVWIGLLILGLLWPSAPIICGADYGKGLEIKRWDHGISDERAGWYQGTGLLVQSLDSLIPNHPWVKRGYEAQNGPSAITASGVGMLGYFAGPRIRIIDNHALTDPLLSRLPTADSLKWRIGHFNRSKPEGYLESIQYDVNLIVDSSLAQYYDTLCILTRGNLWSLERLGVIWRFNFGYHDVLLDRFLKRPWRLSLDEVCTPVALGTPFNDSLCHVLCDNGLVIVDVGHPTGGRVELAVDHNDFYQLVFYAAGIEPIEDTIQLHWIPERGMRVDTLALDELLRGAEIDSICVVGFGGDGKYSLGHFRFIP
ncbi:MAG TPA: hypothetical protein PLF13_10695 [candidate division Zixibacteria bacterium]|nr:hypothetical protein [candidate division Zixibacteria bacterium]